MMHDSGRLDEPKRRRGALATKNAILLAGLGGFCAHGYDGIGLRDIAASAGVTAVLVNRYFGSKEELFSAVVDVAFGGDNPFGGDLSTLAIRLSHAFIAKSVEINDENADPLLLLLRSSQNPRAAEILKAGITRHFAAPLEAEMQGEDASLRVALLLAQIAGFQLMRDVIKLDPLVSCAGETLARTLATMFELQIAPR